MRLRPLQKLVFGWLTKPEEKGWKERRALAVAKK
jgi:hypothetical protein